ncbi:hypothetical protein ACFYTQ_00140 [Nocardia sp. NPDC004068]|uniref:hypothetical protein n=1 Tax=Nocardia sp. NPDC004068 TaxID=3364303 RepID=UPI0036CFD0D8
MTVRWFDALSRVLVSAGLVITGYVHVDLYGHGYRVIHVIGPGFLVQAAVSFALAALVLVGPWTLRVAAALLGLGSVAAFVLSRTTGLFGFSETGWEPVPQAALALAAEVVVVLACLASLAVEGRWRARGISDGVRPVTSSGG